MESFTKKRILIITTGGTIAGNVSDNGVSQKTNHNADSFMEILDNSISVLRQNWNVDVETEIKDLFNIDSSDILPENWSSIAQAIQDDYDNFDAFLVMHGTNTMGYTCAALSFALENINKPVILTGAQVPLGYLGSDAITNLVNSLRIAVWGYHPIKGVIAVFGSKIIAGPRVKKGTDFDYDPFKSFSTGALATIGRFIKFDEPALNKHISYLSKHMPLAIQSRVLSVKKEFNTDQIASLTEFPGMSPTLFQNLVENSDIKAFIFRAFGAGDASTNIHSGLRWLKENQIPIIITSQAPNGISNFQVNDPGRIIRSEDLAIPAHDMSIESMTTKMAWLLAQDFNYEQIKIKMVEDLRGEINVGSELI
jgi:L-asparaginase